MGGPKRLDCGLSETVIARSMTISDESSSVFSYQKALTSFKKKLDPRDIPSDDVSK